VHGIIGSLPGGQVAAGISAIGRRNRQSIIVVDMAQGARYAGVSVGQRESSGVVIEYSGGPCRNRVASGAGRSGRREAGSDVVWNVSANGRGALERRRVAPVTIG
jgi:hypothetical protein